MGSVCALAVACGLLFAVQADVAQARVISTTNGPITINSGNKTGLQQAYAWSNRCKPVPVSFSGHAGAGRLFRVRRMFRVTSGHCAGRAVRGYTVVYLAPTKFKGPTQVQFTLKPANNTNYFRFSRLMIIR